MVWVVWVQIKVDWRSGWCWLTDPRISLGAGVAGELPCLPGFHPANLLAAGAASSAAEGLSVSQSALQRVGCLPRARVQLARFHRLLLQADLRQTGPNWDQTKIRTGQAPAAHPARADRNVPIIMGCTQASAARDPDIGLGSCRPCIQQRHLVPQTRTEARVANPSVMSSVHTPRPSGATSPSFPPASQDLRARN